MKKLFSLTAIAVLALSAIFTSCKKDKEEDPVVESVAISAPATTTLNVYGTDNPMTLDLNAVVLPESYSDKSLTWESSDNNIASVNDEGLVTARNAGQVTIFAYSNANEAKYDSITLTVTRGAHPTWGEIKFLTADTVKVGDQIWSDVVVVENGVEDPAEYDGGTPSESYQTDPGVFRVSILKNTGYGSLFSWQAVNDLKSALCPYPWRTPTADDFIALDIALGGHGFPNGGEDFGVADAPEELLNAYSNWGTTYGGMVGADGLRDQGPEQGMAGYWSSTEFPQELDLQPYEMATALMVQYGENPNAMLTVIAPTQPTPEQIAAGGNPAAWANGCGCPTGTFAMSPNADGLWECMYFGTAFTRYTNPGNHPGKATGLMLRCIK